MASCKSTDLSLVHLLHDHIYTHPANNILVSLKAGEKFRLVEKVSENWWSVIRTEQDHQLLYVPVCYVEEIPCGKPLDGFPVKRDPPPKPPLKPKNLTGKRELPVEASKSFPAITDEARIELFNILISQSNGKSKSQETENAAGYKSSDESELEREGEVDVNVEFRQQWSEGREVFEENTGSAMRHGHRGSMQSLDVEFLDDCEVVEASSNDKSPAEASEQLCVNAELLHAQSQQSGLPPWPPDGAVPLKTFEGGYESYCDSESGRTYYFNRLTQERSWILPRKVSQSAKESVAAEEDSKNGLNAVPSVWKEEVNSNGETVFVNRMNSEKWVRLFNEQHRVYFFNDDTRESQWELPECDSIDGRKFSDDSDRDVYQFSDKVGVLYKAKLSDNGKKIKKSWSHSYVVLCGSMLYFHKEQKATNIKVNMSKPEGFLDLRLATIQMGSTIRSSRKNLIQLTSPSGTEYLLHHEEVDVIEEWYEALSKNISLLTKLMSSLKTEKAGSSHSLNNDKSPSTSPSIQKKSKEKQKQTKKEVTTAQLETVQSSAEKTRLKEKLRFWLNRRPTRDSLRAKGIYKEGIFGSHLLTICEKENANIPKFVQDCIDAVEKRGVTMDGIYRLSGNMAEIQKLRFVVNQNDDYNLMDPDLDIHVVTGALKLFFRELMEPLFPFRFFQKFLDTFRITDHTAKSKALRDLVLLIPSANHDTLKELFRHLVLVIHHSRENRMQAQNVAIVFGPTLMWPEESEMSDLAVSLVQRGQLIEHMLQDYTFIFS